MRHLKSFQAFNDNLVWELKRKPVKPHNMPDVDRQRDYIETVKEEIASILVKIYEFDADKIKRIQDHIWLELKNEWQHILDDSLVNWDTPSVCAQKVLTFAKEYMPFMESI